jgi:hypothetical protein
VTDETDYFRFADDSSRIARLSLTRPAGNNAKARPAYQVSRSGKMPTSILQFFSKPKSEYAKLSEHRPSTLIDSPRRST